MINTNSTPEDSHGDTPATGRAARPVAGPSSNPVRKRGLLIGGGIAAAVILIGGGIGIGLAGTHHSGPGGQPALYGQGGPDNRDQREQSDRRGAARQRDRGNRDGNSQNGSKPNSAAGASSAGELSTIVSAAAAKASGNPVSAKQLRDGSWEVKLISAKTETEVQVTRSVAKVTSTQPLDADDTVPAHKLDTATMKALVSAVLAKAKGNITEVEVDDDAGSPYSITVLTVDHGPLSFDLSSDFAIVGSEHEDLDN